MVVLVLLINTVIYEINGFRIALLEDDGHRIEAIAALDSDKLVIKGYEEKLLKLFEQNDFEGLMASISQTQMAYENGGSYRKVSEGMNHFGYPAEGKLDILNAWVEEYPDSWIPYAARAAFNVGEGGRSRGGAYGNKTSNLQFSRMKQLFLEAERDLLTVIKLKQTYLGAYDFYLTIAKNNVGSLSEHEILAMALEQDPSTYYIRHRYLTTQEPKWGGSYHSIRQSALDAQQYKDNNPRIYSLLGFESAYRATRQSRNNNYQACIDDYTEAFRYGDLYSWRTGRAYCYGKLARVSEQLADLEIVAGKTDRAYIHRQIAGVYANQKLYEKSLEHIDIAIERWPSEAAYYNYKAWLYENMGKLMLAMKTYKHALNIEPYNTYAADKVGRYYLASTDFAEAVPYLEIAARHSKKNAAAWLLYGDALKHLGKEQHMDALAVYLQLVDRNTPSEFENITEIELYLKGKGYWD